MTTLTITKNQIREKIGKKSWFSDQQILTAKLDYVSGITSFDEILNGKTLKEMDGVIHLEKYPKGLLVKIARGFGGIKTHSFPIAKNETEKIILEKTSDNQGGFLVFELADQKKIEFSIQQNKIEEVVVFLNEVKMNFVTEQIKSRNNSIASENTQKHGIPALLSFFIPGVGQLIKGHIKKAVIIWIVASLTGFLLWWTFIAPFIVWVWNVYDAYNSNSK